MKYKLMKLNLKIMLDKDYLRTNPQWSWPAGVKVETTKLQLIRKCIFAYKESRLIAHVA